MKKFGHKQVFPRCEFPLVGIEDFIAFMNKRLSDRQPTSVVRLGDGEGMVMARPTSEDTELWSRKKNHFGHQVTARQIDSLADMLFHSIKSADVVGVRNDIVDVDFHPDSFNLPNDEFLQLFRASFSLRPAEKNLGYRHVIRIAHLHSFLSKQKFHRDTIFTSAWMHFQLSRSGALVKMLRGEKRIGLISSKTALPGALKELLKVDIDYYKVPVKYAKAVAGENNQDHYPGVFDQTMKDLNVAFPGQLFLIGAGICGKIYCQRVKELGGIGLDIGSVCDAWLDIPSRLTVFASLFNDDSGKVPECLLLKNQAGKF